MNYDTMPAGREMDALVAEKVMKHTKEWRERKGRGCLCTIGESCDNCGYPLPYSTSISAAWEVAEKFMNGSPCYMECRNTFGGEWRWRMSFTDAIYEGTSNPWGELERVGEAFAHTAPLAICRAALKAVEGT